MDNMILARRSFIAGSAATGVVLVSGCSTIGGLGGGLVDAVKKLLTRSTSGAFAKLTQQGGFYENQLARLDLPDMLGSRGGVIQSILTSTVFKDQLQKGFNSIAEVGARRAAPLVVDAVRTIGIDNAAALITGGPTAATGFLRNAMAGSLVSAMVPALGEGLKLASNPVIGQLLSSLTGADVSGLTQNLASKTDDSIWGEIGRQEAAIRANPESTNDPVLIAALKGLA